MVGELAEVRVELGAAARDQRLAHAAVQARAAQGGEAVVERRAQQRVRERVAADALGVLAQHAGRDRLLQRLDQRVAVQRAGLVEHVEVRLAADHRGDREHRRARARPAARAGGR